MLNLTVLTDILSDVPGVEAIALGGSRSRGEHHTQSDYDIGIYYDGALLDTDALSSRLTQLDDLHRDERLNAPGQWGPWVNGGAWLTVQNHPVDILLRETTRVERTIRDCIGGTITIDYQCGHPFGFVNTIYAAETHYAKPLWQAESRCLDRLKELLYSKGGYSPLMREAVVQKFLWEAEFSLSCGRKGAFSGDVHYVMGSVFTAVCAWAQVLYALNRRYLMNEKGAHGPIAQFDLCPPDLLQTVNTAYRLIGNGEALSAYAVLDALQQEITALAETQLNG